MTPPPQSIDSTSPIPLPPPTATPSEVRTYFTTLLTTLHGLDEAKAREIASRWNLGRGEELRSYDIDSYHAIFGWEPGTVFFGHVNRKQKQTVRAGVDGKVKPSERDRTKRDIFGLEPGLSLIYICFFAMLGLAWNAYVEPDDMRAAAMATISGMFLLSFGASYCIFYFA
ncbi:hypothetical protein DL95DRAFT_371756 [Leptodontidium sp. 2 PMI_412]|nr:hypothetical protein DL95DRAFT_371756 [Leptodontidium sp. 2 PMI_412]